MRISVPVTDYIPASVLTTLNDIVVRGAADPERRASIDWQGVFVGELTRNAVGVQVITGVGFTPRLIVFFAHQDDVLVSNLSWGFGNLTYNMALRLGFAVLHGGINNARCIDVVASGVKSLDAYVSAVGADGFSLTWDKAGTIEVDAIYWVLP